MARKILDYCIERPDHSNNSPEPTARANLISEQKKISDQWTVMTLLSAADRSTLKPLWTEAAPVGFTPVLVSTVVSERLTSQSQAGAGAGRRWWQGGRDLGLVREMEWTHNLSSETETELHLEMCNVWDKVLLVYVCRIMTRESMEDWQRAQSGLWQHTWPNRWQRNWWSIGISQNYRVFELMWMLSHHKRPIGCFSYPSVQVEKATEKRDCNARIVWIETYLE